MFTAATWEVSPRSTTNHSSSFRLEPQRVVSSPSTAKGAVRVVSLASTELTVTSLCKARFQALSVCSPSFCKMRNSVMLY